jgi:hypothetical protein
MSPIVFRGLIDQTNSQALLPLELWSDQFGQCNYDFSRRPLFFVWKKKQRVLDATVITAATLSPLEAF